MTASFSNLTKKPLYWLLIIFIISSIQAFSQKNLSGNINEPFAKVTALLAADVIEVDDVSEFSVEDTILIIQMQGVGILTAAGVYGNYQTSFGTPGAHEFLIIENIDPGQNRITFKNNLLNSYDLKGNIQIVRVTYYFSAIVDGPSPLTVDPWNPVTGKGGVLALILGKALTLNADIDLSGLGFKGAPGTTGLGKARSVANTNLSSYHVDSLNAGSKGEGIAIHDQLGGLLLPNHAKGEGKNYTGGGGGNGRFSGGGGGSHRGDGGIGGYEDWPTPSFGGIGGIKVGGSLADNRLFMGGGGGSSTSNSGAGGDGGGIVIIVTDTLIGNGKNIIVNGNNGQDAVAPGGAGGAGAGGSIAISLTSFGPAASVLNLQAKGGNGGNNPAAFGEGGGGGGGLIYLSKAAAANVISNFNGGGAGIPTDGGTGGGAGEKKEDFKAILNGFLFNTIRSSVTGTQTDSICSDTDPPKLTGTTPIGGSGTYTYSWEKSSDNVTFIPIAGATSIDYDPSTPEPATLYYRRVVTDGTLIDRSKSVRIIVQPYIKNNTIGADQTICYNQDPAALISTGVLADGNGHYAFKWEASTDNVTFSPAPNTNGAQNYDPSNLTDNAWYRRMVTSGRCVNISAPVAITVLDTISKNRIINNLPQDKCFGAAFSNLQGSTTATFPNTLAGGDNTFRYKWQSNINGSGWIDAPPVNNLADYDPGELPERTPMNEYFFRRVVSSGPGDVCQSTSNTVHLRDFPVIKNNSITSDQTICSGLRPLKLAGTIPGAGTSDLKGGDGTYKYTWQESKAPGWVWTDIAGLINSDSSSFKPPNLNDTVRYRRIVNSNDCSDISSPVIVNVHKTVTNFGISTLANISDTTLCFGQNPNRLRGQLPIGGTLLGDFTYQWFYSDDNASFSPVVASGTSPGYDPPALTKTQYYKRQSKSGACTVLSTAVSVNILPLISNNIISAAQTVCPGSAPAQLTGATLSGGSGSYTFRWEQSTDGGSTWNNAVGNYTNASGNYSPPVLVSAVKYRRWVTSGPDNCCSDLSAPVDISIHPALPTGQITNSDTTVYSETPVLVNLALTGSGPWDVTLSENAAAGAAVTVNQANSVITIDPQTPEVDSFIYRLVSVKDKNGCLAVNPSGQLIATLFPGFDVPEGFSPNGDGINDTFEIRGLNALNPEEQAVDLHIYTSAGSEVFKTANTAGEQWQVWDGRDSSGKDLPQGTYYYLLKIKTVLNERIYKFSGFIILKRY